MEHSTPFLRPLLPGLTEMPRRKRRRSTWAKWRRRNTDPGRNGRMCGWSREDGDVGGSESWTDRTEKHIPVKQGPSGGVGAVWEQGWGDV